MEVLILEIFFFFVLFMRGIQNEPRPNGENVCLQTETYYETIVEKVRKPVVKYKNKFCWKPFKKFSCNKRITTWEMVDNHRVVPRSKSVPKCCTGYKEQTEDKTRCVPVCPTGCVHGTCTSPNTCTCTYGFHGQRCHLNSVTTITKKAKSSTSSTQKASTHKIFQATEKTEERSATLTSELLKMTNTDFATQTTVSSTEVTVSVTGEVSDLTSTTELENTEDEREISKDISIAAKGPLNLTTSVTASTEETTMEEILWSSNLIEKTGPPRNVASNSKEPLSSEGNEVPTNANTIPELQDPTQSTEIVQNIRVYHSKIALYVLPAISVLVLGSTWLIIKHRKNLTESKTEKQQMTAPPEEQTKFRSENLFWSKPLRNRKESPISAQNAAPVLLNLKVHNGSPTTHSGRKALLLEKPL